MPGYGLFIGQFTFRAVKSGQIIAIPRLWVGVIVKIAVLQAVEFDKSSWFQFQPGLAESARTDGDFGDIGVVQCSKEIVQFSPG